MNILGLGKVWLSIFISFHRFHGLSSWSLILQFLVIDSSVLFLIPFKLLASLSGEGCKKIREGRKEGKRPRYRLTQNFISGFKIAILKHVMFSWTSRNISRFPDTALNNLFKSHFRWFYEVEVQICPVDVFN